MAAVPLGGGGAWPGFEATRPTARQQTRHCRCGGRRRDRRAWLQFPWAAGPGRASNTFSTPGAAGVEGAGGTGGHGRASRRGAERSEVA